MRNIPLLVALAATLALAACAGPGPTAFDDPPQAVVAAPAVAAERMGCDASALQQTVVERINAARRAGACADASLGPAAPLAWQPALARAASLRASEIARSGTFGRVADPAPRLRQAGYAATAAQEGQVAGDYSMDGAALALLGQQRTCTTLLSPAWTDIGAACVTRPGSEFSHYWDVVVAKGAPVRVAMGNGAGVKGKKGPHAKQAAGAVRGAGLDSRLRGNDGLRPRDGMRVRESDRLKHKGSKKHRRR